MSPRICLTEGKPSEFEAPPNRREQALSRLQFGWSLFHNRIQSNVNRLSEIPSVPVRLTRHEIANGRVVVYGETIDVSLRRRASVRVDRKNPHPQRLLPSCASDLVDP